MFEYLKASACLKKQRLFYYAAIKARLQNM